MEFRGEILKLKYYHGYFVNRKCLFRLPLKQIFVFAIVVDQKGFTYSTDNVVRIPYVYRWYFYRISLVRKWYYITVSHIVLLILQLTYGTI